MGGNSNQKVNNSIFVVKCSRKVKWGDTQVLIFCWLFLLLVKIDAATFEVNMISYSRNIKKQFQLQLTNGTTA